MRARLLINVVLLLAVTGLSLLLIYDEDTAETTVDVQLTTLDPATITNIVVERPTGTTVTFSKTGTTWYMQQPYAHTANSNRIHTMLKLLQAHSYTQINATDVDLARFLLDATAVAITFNDTRIAFGDSSPIAEQRYVLVNNTVHLINDSLFQQLQAPASFFLSTRMLPDNANIQSITLPDYTITRQDDVWAVDPAAAISADQVVRVVHAWQQLDAVSVREYAPGENHGSIGIDLGAAGRLDFIIVAPAPQLILARADLGLQYHISGYDAEQLLINNSGESMENHH